MDEPIEWHDLGTVTFREFDDGDREMRRPKFGQIRYFQRQLREITDSLQDEIKEKQDAVAAAAESGDLEALTALNEAIRELNAWGIIERFIPWYRQVFEQLSEPLPEDSDEWPGYFTDASLPPRILNQWKMRPKAFGANQAP